MKIILNTRTRSVKTQSQKQDEKKLKDELEADVSIILSFALASFAKKYYGTKGIRELFIDDICNTAKTMLKKEGNWHEQMDTV